MAFFFFEASQFNLAFHLKLSNEIFSQFFPSFSRSFNILANKKFSLLLLHLLLQECEKWLKKGQTCTFLEHSLDNLSLIDQLKYIQIDRSEKGLAKECSNNIHFRPPFSLVGVTTDLDLVII